MFSVLCRRLLFCSFNICVLLRDLESKHRSALTLSSARDRFFSFLAAMASIEDITKMMLLLKLTNFAESLPETKTCFHVRRISFIVTILDDDGCADDVIVNHAEPPSPEYQQVLNWQAEPEELQDDLEVRNSLTQLSGKLCPYKNISTSIYDKVKSNEDTQRMQVGNHPLSSYRHLSFRSAMLTRHSAGDDGLTDGHPELLFHHDGLGGEQSFMRWRSHDFIKVTPRKPRPYFRVFWLTQWDIVDFLQRIDSPNDNAATNQGKRRRSPSFHQLQDPMKRPGDYEKYHGVQHKKKRKSPWIAEVRRKGNRKKIWLGNYKTPEAAARAADAGSFYFDRGDKLNFRDSPQYLVPMPQVLSDESKEKFVVNQARRLAELTEMQPSRLPSTWDPYNRTSYRANPADNSTQAIVEGSPNSDVDVLVPLQDSVRGSGFTDLDVHPSTSHGGEHIHASGCSTPEDLGLLWLSSPNVSPLGICSSREAANSLCDDFPSSLWNEDPVQDISGDIAGESAPSEIWADQADDISGHWSLFPGLFQ